MTRVAFLGTPEAAVPVLRAANASFEVAAVITRPDAQDGGPKRARPSPIRSAAVELALEVHMPSEGSEINRILAELAPLDLAIVAAYGRLLAPEALRIPRMGMLNVHFSLLPRWRGAAPVARALMAGDSMTGITVIHLDEGWDTGPVLTAQAVDIKDGENAGELTDRLARLGGQLAIGAATEFLDGSLKPVTQSEEGATYAAKITGDDRPLSVTQSVEDFVNQIRGLAPTPGATLRIDGRVMKILEGSASEKDCETGAWAVREGRPVVGLASGVVELKALQPPGKTPMSGAAWVNGLRAEKGKIG